MKLIAFYAFLPAVAALVSQKTAFGTPKKVIQAQPLQSTSSKVESNEFIQTLKQTAVFVPFVISAFAFAAVPQQVNAGDITKGNVIFTSNCIGCHRGGQNFVKEQKTLQKDALDKYIGLDEEKVFKFFKGSFVHKAIGGKLMDDEVLDVISYVVDQARGDKW